ncbi:pectate lyase [Sphingobacterium corticibacterium]|uniref:Pectate lyase n=1 Tax=Sphingobacterium corticibacterium TaxID=2484746 RepID=A0A4Q6XSF1_9SPHI|nr:pectate lyase [Sphingobacterium corticibacterium]RZF60394.1 pectate lyase [Sphingobacterium corticibacterium]
MKCTRFSILFCCLFGLSFLAFAQEKDSLAEKVLVYQLPNGAWGKQLVDKKAVNYALPLTKELLQKIKATDEKHATIDNGATTREINILIEAYTKTQHTDYLNAARRGIEYLLEAQYENGGFPQYYPNKSLYRAQITYNDNAMINVLTVLDNLAKETAGFAALADDRLKERAVDAVTRGIDCILKTQIIQGDSLTIWAAQYNEKTLQPEQARAFEPVSLSTSESVNIVRFLMKQPVTPAIERAIEAAVQWFEVHDLEGYRFDKTKHPKTGKTVRDLVPDSTSVIWSRFYDIANNKPLFGDRDNSVTYDFSEISDERKNGYAWFGNWPIKLLEKEYPKWKENKVIKK